MTIKGDSGRYITKRVMCGNVPIGGDSPVSIQSMTNTSTADAASTAGQIISLAEAGCDIVRCAIPDDAAARALPEIKDLLVAAGIHIPIVADIHYDYKLALSSIESGADKIRINPGNIGGYDSLKAVVEAAGKADIPIRIGVNSGSLEKNLLESYGPTREALALSALQHISLIRDMGFSDIVVSAKTSSVRDTIAVYRMLANMSDCPLHLGVTEAGIGQAAVVKSAMGIGALLADGIGDTIRVSMTGNPVNEVRAARQILAGLHMLSGAIDIISCPTCGRCQVDLERIVNEVLVDLGPIESALQARVRAGDAVKPIKLAIMGCPVNGPGEAAQADMGVACGRDGAVWFESGRIIRRLEIPQIRQTIHDAIVAEYGDILHEGRRHCGLEPQSRSGDILHD